MSMYTHLHTYLYYFKVYRIHETVSNLPVRISYVRKLVYFSLAFLRRVYTLAFTTQANVINLDLIYIFSALYN